MSKRENELVRTGMELLWMSERYRKTLVKIQKINDNPEITNLIRQVMEERT